MLKKIQEKSPHTQQVNVSNGEPEGNNNNNASNGNSETHLSALGQAGDLYGGINALFAALAFSGVAAATLMQARSLQLAREQQLQQSFEPLFFHLLNLHKEVSIPRFKLRAEVAKKARGSFHKEGEDSGHEFQRAMSILRRAMRMKVGYTHSENERKIRLINACEIHYNHFYAINQNELGPHFRTLFQIFKLIDHSSFNLDSKIRYANIARSTLSKDQLFLLAVNCISKHGAEFKPLVEKYGLLKHIARNNEQQTIDEQIATFCFQRAATLGTADRRKLI